ncbi:MAG: FG-GAP-like repeat-containing protein, partial [Myxococcota bacterium]
MSLPILSRPLCAGAALTWLLTACTGPPETDGTAMPAPERPLDLAADVRARAAEAGLTALPVAPEVREELFVLGQALAFDKILSGPQNISCMTCHHPSLATGDARSLSLGEGGLGLGEERVGGAVVPRNAQPLFNLHALGSLFWDQRVRRGPDSIETPADALITPEMRDVFEFGAVSAQAMFPVTSREEMRGQRFRNGPDDNELAPFAAVDEIWELLVERLVAIPEYVTLFAAAYPDTDVDDLTFAHAANAIAGFEVRAFEARQSPWNRFLEGDDTALTDLELEGAAAFIAAGCVECHRGPMLTDDQAHNTGLAQFGPGHDDGPLHNEDYGRGGETGAADRYAFRTAPLVNVALTGPWGHAGQYGELQRFVEHYADPAEELRSYVAAHEVADGERYLADMGATDADAILAGLDDAATVEIGDMEALLAFLGALTDPASRDLAWTVPDVVPSGLPVDDAPAPVIGGASEGTVGFVDLAAEPTSGLADYHRVPSARNAIAEFWQQQSLDEPMDFFGVFATPLRWRGMPGVSIFDYDLDGDEDLFVTNGPGAPNSLLQNQLLETGELTFVDRAAAAGVEATATDSSGSCYGDIDNDGDHDLFVVADAGRSHLFENDGDGTFTDISVESGSVVDGIGGTSCAFGDIDGDGLLDLFVARAWHQDDLQACFLEPFGAGIQHNELYLNAGANTFVDVSDTSGIRDLGGLPPFAQGAPTITWSVSLVDYDLDGDVDIFTADDQCGLPNSTIGGLDRGFLQVFDNDGTGTFTNRTVEAGTNEPSAWMGLSFGDFDSDGYLDFFSPSFGDWGKLVAGAPVILGDETSRWFLGGPDKTFDNPGVGDLQRMPFGWGTVARDFDNDGDTDISFQGGMDLWFMVDASNPGSVLSNDGDAHFGLDRGAFATNHT